MTDDYPLNCITDTGDGFSGWFAISNPKQCNDFCYWSTPTDTSDSQEYSAFNTANPHNVTMITNGNVTYYWECVYDSASDNVLTLDAVGERWVDSYRRFVKGETASSATTIMNDGVPFPYLKCQKGSGEELSTWDGELVQSALFWECWIAVCLGVLLVQLIVGGLYWKKRRRRYRMIRSSTGDVSSDSAGIVEPEEKEEIGFHSLQLSESVNDVLDNLSLSSIDRFGVVQESEHLTPRCKLCTPMAAKLCNTASSRKKWKAAIRTLLILGLNILMAFSIAFSSISLMEINNSPYFQENMRQWTPACSNPDLVCPNGNVDIKNESTKPNRDAAGPFSYLIASDAQLNWFNGEFAQMGLQNLPPACTPTDSCWSCTRKHGQETNLRLKRGWESLMSGNDVGMGTFSGLPVPDTLVMNGKSLDFIIDCFVDLSYDLHLLHWLVMRQEISRPTSIRLKSMHMTLSTKISEDWRITFRVWGEKSYCLVCNQVSRQSLQNACRTFCSNHDIEHKNGAMYGGDQWWGPPNCNTEHAIGYFKSGFCGQIPNFQSDRIVRYDASSLAYSWEEGRYHFVHTHYYPTYEMASMQVRSSMDWLHNDLAMARDAGFTTVMFVHAANYLNPATEKVILGKNVVAIIAGTCLASLALQQYASYFNSNTLPLLQDTTIDASTESARVSIQSTKISWNQDYKWRSASLQHMIHVRFSTEKTWSTSKMLT